MVVVVVGRVVVLEELVEVLEVEEVVEDIVVDGEEAAVASDRAEPSAATKAAVPNKRPPAITRRARVTTDGRIRRHCGSAAAISVESEVECLKSGEWGWF